jgi:tRNA modification GTPase
MIKETVQFGGVHVNLYDTAGIRDADCEIEKIGIEKSRAILAKAEVSVIMLDALSGIDSFDEEILKITENKKSVILLNKTDCADDKEIAFIKKKIARDVIDFSALTGFNFSEFHSKLSEAVRSNFSGCTNSFIADMRVINILEHSSDAADNLVNSIICGNPEEIIAVDAAELINSLSEITGIISPDDILNSIFGRFCIGK